MLYYHDRAGVAYSYPSPTDMLAYSCGDSIFVEDYAASLAIEPYLFTLAFLLSA